MKALKLTFLLSIIAITASAQQKIKPIAIEAGVSRQLAAYRKSVIGAIHYHLRLNVPDHPNETVTGAMGLRFELESLNQPLQIDFKQPVDHIQFVEVAGFGKIQTVFENEHIIIDKKYLKKGQNFITVTFTA